MPDNELPDLVKGFIHEHIQSVTQIEILALMQGAPEREWTSREVDQSLRSNEQSIARQLAGFARAGLLVEIQGSARLYRYEPRTPALAAGCIETVRLFKERPVHVIETIFKPVDSARTFADAFRIRPR